MKRINIVVEGQAEETYINEVLSIHLAQFDVGAVARRVEFCRRKQRVVSRGGLFDYPDYSREITRLKAETDRYSSPEEIDEGTATAPSKRILKYVPIYDKVVGGSLMAMDIGLHAIRSRCHHFHQWLMKLEALAQPM